MHVFCPPSPAGLQGCCQWRCYLQIGAASETERVRGWNCLFCSCRCGITQHYSPKLRIQDSLYKTVGWLWFVCKCVYHLPYSVGMKTQPESKCPELLANYCDMLLRKTPLSKKLNSEEIELKLKEVVSLCLTWLSSLWDDPLSDHFGPFRLSLFTFSHANFFFCLRFL